MKHVNRDFPMFPIHVRRSYILSCMALVGVLALSAPSLAAQAAAAQPARQIGGGLNPEAFYGKETFQGVAVRDSLEAIKKLEDARRMERLRDWNKAADWYQEVIEKYGQYVVPSGTDDKGNIRQYTGIERPVQEQLAKWPKEGLDAYRNRYGAIANTLLQNAGRDDRESLSRILKLYFVTDAGKVAGIRLIDLLLETGEFAEAARIGDRLFEWHPNLNSERPRVLFRTALAYHLSGDATKARLRADQLKNQHADTMGTLYGKDVVLSSTLERLLQNAPPSNVVTATNSIRLNPGGNMERSMVSSAKGRPGARMASIELAPPPVKLDPNQQKQIEAAMGRQATDTSGNNPGIMPVLDDDELYFQDGSRVYAVSLASGVPLPGWMQTYPNTNGQYTIKSFSFSRSQYTLTLTDNLVLGVMGAAQRVNPYGGSTPAYGTDLGTRLVCLNRADGTERWVARPAKLNQENLRQGIEFSGSPLVVGDNIYVLGRGGKNYNEDCYVFCFDINSGNHKWSCFIASASNGNMYYMGNAAPSGDTLSHLAYSSGRIFVLTNLGVCAAIDAYAGDVTWLNIYPRDNASSMNPEMGFARMSRGGSSGQTKVWDFNPVIVQEGKVFIIPTDGRQNIVVYDTGTGAELKRIPVADIRAPEDPVGPAALLAADGNELILTGGAFIYCIDWTAFQPGKNNGLVWRNELVREIPSKGFQRTEIRGRGFVTNDSVFVCTEANLYRIERRDPKTGKTTGKLRELYPAKDRFWDEGEGPGNVLVTSDRVIVAGAKRVNVYADMVLARKKLDDDVAFAPTDPEPRLRYAEVMFVAGELPTAMEKLNETAELLGGLKSMRPGPSRDHFFNDCITFATKLQKDKKSDNVDQMIESVNKLYDLAAAAADGDSQQVNYRISRAQFNRDFKQDGSLLAAVKLYQEILLNPKLRTVPLMDDADQGGTTQAALVAEKLIDRVRKLSPNVYDDIEQQAADAMTAAGTDPALLRAVADSYPNSKAASKAMIAAAAEYEKQGNNRLAAHTLRHVYNKYGESADRAQVLEGLARNYLAMPNRTADRVDTAAARLSAIMKLGKGDGKLAKPLVLPGNKELVKAGTSVSQALKAVQNFKSQAVAARLADFHLPPALTSADSERFARAMEAWKAAGSPDGQKPRSIRDPFLAMDPAMSIEDVTAIISPPRELRQQHSRHDRIVVFSNANLVMYGVGSKDAVGRSSVLTGTPRNLAWLDGNAGVLVWSENEIALLRGDNLDKRWKLELKSLPRIEVVAGGSVDTMTARDPNEEQIIVGGGQPMVLRRRLINGRFVQQLQPMIAVPQAANPGGGEQILWVKPVDDRVIVATSAGQLFAVKLPEGAIAWHTRLASNLPVERMVASDDFVVAKITDTTTTQLIVLDTLTGQLVRRMSFANDTGNLPVNVALAPDGMLVWTQPDRLCGKDLFEPRKDLNYEVVAGSSDAARRSGIEHGDGQFNPVYAGAAQPDQLLITEGRILAVTHNGKFVSIHSLETGKLLDYQNEDGRRAEARLSTVGGSASVPVSDWGVSLQVVGQYVYISSRSNGPMAYHLDQPFKSWWSGVIDPDTSPNILYQDPLIGQDYFVVVCQPRKKAANAPAPAGPSLFRLYTFDRAKFDDTGCESGRCNYARDVRDDAGITDWEGVEGGVYYLTQDKKLHFLRGARGK